MLFSRYYVLCSVPDAQSLMVVLEFTTATNPDSGRVQLDQSIDLPFCAQAS